MIVGARCTNSKCKNGKSKELFTNITDLTNRGLGGWNGPWKCPDCKEVMYTERRATDKAEDSQKKPPVKSQKHRVSTGTTPGKPRRKKLTKKNTSKKHIVKKS